MGKQNRRCGSVVSLIFYHFMEIGILDFNFDFVYFNFHTILREIFIEMLRKNSPLSASVTKILKKPSFRKIFQIFITRKHFFAHIYLRSNLSNMLNTAK